MPDPITDPIVFALYVLMLLTVATNVASAAYVMTAIRSVVAFQRHAKVSENFLPPVSVLKPVCGLDAGLHENLRSFCRQNYPEYQIVFGVHDADDPAVAVVRKLIDQCPETDIVLVIENNTAGANLKAGNLENMYRAAKHDYLIIADSDMRVDERYIRTVVAPFEDAKIGVVTCLYKGTSRGGFPSILSSMFINEWFLPSVLVSAGLREIRFCFGATMAVRRHVLDMIGGFKLLSQYLADDHMLGRLASDHGFKVALSGYVVENVIFEKSLKSLFQHELRWSRTVRAVEPLGHAFSFIMYGVPLAFFGALMVDVTYDWDFFEVALIALAVTLRVWMHKAVRKKLELPKDGSLWLVPLRDMLSFVVWGASFFSRQIRWRGKTFVVRPNGLIDPIKEPTA